MGIKAKDWSGIKLHRLTFMEPVGKNSNRRTLWKAMCECGNIITTLPAGVVQGNTQSCGCFAKEVKRDTGLKNRTFSPYISSARAVWQRGYNDGDVTFDDFFRLSQLPCNYCGRQPFRVYNHARKNPKYKPSAEMISDSHFIYNGLDRVDSSISEHTLANVVPCCYTCNLQKGNMTLQEFILHNERQYLHMASLREKLQKEKS
jgi:hypothetical protein